MSLSGKVVAITGGGRGIGLATAKAFAEQGARVAIGDIDTALAEAAAQSINGFGAFLDVRDRDSFDAFLIAIEQTLEPVDVLVNNAGIMPTGPFHEESDAFNDQRILQGLDENARRGYNQRIQRLSKKER